MPSPRDKLLRLAAEDRQYLDRLDAAMIREIEAAYERARREILGTITDRRNALYTGTFAGERETRLLELARDVELLRQIDMRQETLMTDLDKAVREALARARNQVEGVTQEELDLILGGLDLPPFFYSFAMVDYATVEIGIETSLATLMQTQRQVAEVLKAELRVGLIQGESFEQLTKRLLAKDASVFVRGKTSAMLGARRNVITANNAGRQAAYETWSAHIPELGKQAIAAIDGKTTDCCLQVHGQVRPLDKPFDLTGEPRFADQMMYPAFHWNCRTSSVPYHPDFEQGARITTPDMVRAAQDELTAREETGERVEISPAHATSRR